MERSCFVLAGVGVGLNETVGQTGQDHVQWTEAIARLVDGLHSANDSIRHE